MLLAMMSLHSSIVTNGIQIISPVKDYHLLCEAMKDTEEDFQNHQGDLKPKSYFHVTSKRILI